MSKNSRRRIPWTVWIAGFTLLSGAIAALANSSVLIEILKRTPVPTIETSPTPAQVSILVFTTTPLPPTFTPLPTNTIVPTATPMPGDFELNIEGWGDYLENGLPKPGENVNQYCNSKLPITHTGKCSLKYQPLEVIRGNAYVARFSNAEDVKSLISIWVYVPSDELCSGNQCSTARIIAWDNKYKSHEGEYVDLNRIGEWVEVVYDLSGTNFPQPYRAIGVHFYLSTQYEGALYIDSVNLTHPK